MLVVRANGREPRYSLREKLWALTRFAGSLIRAIHPRAERPPFPDANLANIGGAIIPALGGAGARRATVPDEYRAVPHRRCVVSSGRQLFTMEVRKLNFFDTRRPAHFLFGHFKPST